MTRDYAKHKGFIMPAVHRLLAVFIGLLVGPMALRPDRTSSPGWHKLEVRVKRRGVTLKARSGYFVPSKS